MKKFMIRFLFAVGFVTITVLACSRNIFNFNTGDEKVVVTPHFDKNGYWKTDNFTIKRNQDKTFSYYGTNSLYGAYLAARVAH